MVTYNCGMMLQNSPVVGDVLSGLTAIILKSFAKYVIGSDPMVTWPVRGWGSIRKCWTF